MQRTSNRRRAAVPPTAPTTAPAIAGGDSAPLESPVDVGDTPTDVTVEPPAKMSCVTVCPPLPRVVVALLEDDRGDWMGMVGSPVDSVSIRGFDVAAVENVSHV